MARAAAPKLVSGAGAGGDLHRARDIKRIHAAKSRLHIEDDVYQTIVAEASGGRTTTSTELTPAERLRVLSVLAKREGKPAAARQDPRNPGSTWQHAAKLKKLMAMWWALADAGAVQRPAGNTECRQAVEAWATQHMAAKQGAQALQALRLASTEQMHLLIEALKKWGKRAGANIQ